MSHSQRSVRHPESEAAETIPSARRSLRTGVSRVSQACARCRTGKTRCDGQTPTCSSCADLGYRCVYAATQKTRGPGKGKQRMEALEERLAKMESMLRQGATGVASTVSSVSTPSGTNPGSSPPLSAPTAHSTPQEEVTPSSSGMLAFLQVSERIGSSALWQREECIKSLDRMVLSHITAEAPELWLVEAAIDHVCAELPFLRIPWLLDQIKRPDATSKPDAWWQGILNAVIASAIHPKTVISSFAEVAMYSWAFFRNAYAVLPELILHGNSLGAAQAVMAMAMFMRLSADTRTTALLLSIAARMQISTGLHIMATDGGIFSPAEAENVGRVRLASFILDVDISVNTGLAPVHANLNVVVDLPGESWLDRSRRDTVFRLRVELARILSRVGPQLSQLTVPREAALLALESELDAWVLRVPPEIRPDYGEETRCAGENEAVELGVVMLHLVYYNCRFMICWAFARLAGYEALQSQRSMDSVDDKGEDHRRMARSSARATLRSLSWLPTQSFADLWRALCYPVSASIALLAIVCKNPAHPASPTDLSLLASFVRFLERMVRDEGCDLQRVLNGVTKFERVAKDAVAVAMTSAMPVNPSLWPLTLASGRTGNAIGTLLTCSAHHPMYVAQSLMGNTPNLDLHAAKQLAQALVIPWGENGYGPFVPDSLMPATYGFTFGSDHSG